jgi:hypothetical protein
MKKIMLLLMVFSLLSMGEFLNCNPQCEIKVVDENGSPVTGAQVVFYDKSGTEIRIAQPNSNGSVFYRDEWGYKYVSVIPPEGMEAVAAEYQTMVQLSSNTITIVLRNKSGSVTATSTTTTTTSTTSTSTTTTSTTTTSTTTQPATTTSTTSTSGTSALSSTSTTETTTSARAEPFVWYPVNVNSLCGYNPGTESAFLIQDYIDRELLVLYKNSNGVSRVLIEFALDQPALREWLSSVESYSAYLILPRTSETAGRQHQAAIYSVDMEAWQSQTSSTPPRSPYINEFSYNFQDLWVNQSDPMGPEIAAVFEKELMDSERSFPGEPDKWDFIRIRPETAVVDGGKGNLDILIDTPGGTQMTPGTELAWYDSAAIIFFQNP